MGCISSKRSLDDFETNCFRPFELSLGFKNLSSKHIDRVFHRFSSMNCMTQAQFERACSTLKIDLAASRAFFYNFLKEQRYSVKHLSTLGVMLGSGSVTEKAGLLFENYDDDLSNTLDVSEIHTMIKDLVLIASEYIPRFVFIGNELNEDLKGVVKKLNLVGNYLAKTHLEEIMDEEHEISKETFISKVEKKFFGLLRTETIRKGCIVIYKQSLEPIEGVIKAFDNKVLENNPVLHRHCSMRGESQNKKNHVKRNSL